MGKGKVLKTTISLLGKIDPSLGKALSKAQKKSRDTGNGMSKNMKNAGSAMTKSIKGFAKTAMAVFASISAVSKLKDYANECVTAAKAQIDAETKLQSVLENVESIQIRGPNAAAKAAENLKNTASSIQKTGVVGDEVLLSGMQQLATFQLDDSTISTLSTGMADLLAQQKGLDASQSDAVSVANMIGKVMTGSTSALSRVGITFTDAQEQMLKTGDVTQRAATLAEVLQQNVGGVNKALASTDQGKLQQAQNTIGDLKEEIGKKLLPIIANVASKAVPFLGKAFDKIGGAIDKISPHVEEVFDFLLTAANQVSPVVESIGRKLADGIGGQLPSITSLLQGAFGIIQQIAPPIMTVIGVIGQALSPIVSALSNVAQMLLPKIASLVQSLGPLFQALSPILQFIGGGIASLFQSAGSIIGDFLGVVQNIINVLTGIIDFVVNVFTGNWQGAWESIKSIFSNVWGAIKGIARAALTAVVSPINAIIGGINKVGGEVGIPAIPTIEIPEFAEGTTVTKPTLAVVGEGSDPETIVPHNNKPRSRQLLANAAAGVGVPIGKGGSYTYAPIIYANNAQGVKEVLDEDFERFKEFMERYNNDEGREVFA
ncbi:MAG: hypothetical protein MR945_09135 [Agathobacter sp.]|nr:hypothetical protein [Agathobacter sp.]